MRGKPAGLPIGPNHERNIPAYAGKTAMVDWSQPKEAEHPRVCGENGLREGFAKVMNGTSPRMRGKPFLWGCLPSVWRNIPAYAGKTTVCR